MDAIAHLDAHARFLWWFWTKLPAQVQPPDVIGKTLWDVADNAEELIPRFSLCKVDNAPQQAVLVGEPSYRVLFLPCDLTLTSSVSVVGVFSLIPPELARLTPREREVLALLPDDLSTKEIAKRLGIAYTTAETHVRHLKLKLSCRGIAGLVKFAIHSGLSLTRVASAVAVELMAA